MFSRVPLERIFDNPFQTRTVYVEIEELGQSIFKMREARPETSGLMQVPSARLVMPNGKGWEILNPDEYGGVESALGDEPGAVVQLAFGHRRLRAFHGLAAEEGEGDYNTFPVEIVPLNDQQMADLAWEENEKRKDLTAIEEALALQQAIELFGYTQSQIGERWGLSQSAVANKLRLLQLPREAQEAIRQGELTEKHGRVLLAALGKSKRIYEEVARAILPTEVEKAAAERAKEIFEQVEGHGNWYKVREPRNAEITKLECEACGQVVYEANRFYQPYYTCNYPGPRTLCIPCYREASGWATPSTTEAEGIVRQKINQNSSRLINVEWPMDREFETPVNGTIARKLPACNGCPAREIRDKEDWCLDKACFEQKGRQWKEEQFAAVRARLERDYGEAWKSVEITEGYTGQTLSTHGVDQDLIKNGVCVPGKCKRLRLKYQTYQSTDEIKPYADLPFVWNCDNSNAHTACQRRYLASQATENEKSEQTRAAELANKRKLEAKDLALRATEAVRQALAAGKLETWQGMVEKVNGYGKGKDLASVEICQEKIAQALLSDIFGQLGYRDWDTTYAMESFQQSLSREMGKLGIALPANTSEIGRKLERIYEFVSSGRVKGSLTPEQVEGNWTNLEKLAEELKGLPIDSEERMRLFNQFIEVSDELWEAATEMGLDWPQKKAIISQEMIGLEAV